MKTDVEILIQVKATISVEAFELTQSDVEEIAFATVVKPILAEGKRNIDIVDTYISNREILSVDVPSEAFERLAYGEEHYFIGPHRFYEKESGYTALEALQRLVASRECPEGFYTSRHRTSGATETLRILDGEAQLFLAP